MLADRANPEGEPTSPPEPSFTSGTERRRNTETQPPRPSFAVSQSDANEDAPFTVKGSTLMPTSSATAADGPVAGFVISALNEEAR
ncbi:hypothetical protein CABS01_16759 [Colletotrichum abscissum]|uniref:Uncharacterized protein n=2 Tax=Colletotrichum acutatum species complex TaxID=2707335 RepID=A0A9P9X1Z6_9PEZI|nr:uncharacterized protein CABS01_16759 [Colletotrichum abscissum]KAI3532112.1 hypothetical protein CABS02_13953 [Colletotrichum abscissum]KAK1514240.1 hypothetical protein CABS01_16759 [Colletotrichum abscissum]